MVRTNPAKPTDESFAPEYSEIRVEADAADLAYARFGGLSFINDSARDGGGKTAIEFEYTTSHGNTKVVRSLQATKASEHDTECFPDDADLEGVSAFTFYDGGDGYAYTDDGRLWSYGADHTYRCVGDVDAVYRVDLPEAAPITGAIQGDVDVTVHYRSTRSGNMKQMRLEDVSIDWEGDRVRGYHARRDRTVEVEAVFERSVTTKGTREVEVGKVARIDFPAGHRYTVDAYNVPDDDAGRVHAAVEEAVRMVEDDYDADVTHDGRIDD